MATKVINIKSGEYYDQYIGRAGHGFDGYYGNPFRLSPHDTKGSTLIPYKEYFEHRITTDPVFKQRILKLKDKTLACFCKPDACHGDIIAEWLNKQ